MIAIWFPYTVKLFSDFMATACCKTQFKHRCRSGNTDRTEGDEDAQ